MKNSSCGLADLVDLIQAGQSQLLPVVAELIGFEQLEIAIKAPTDLKLTNIADSQTASNTPTENPQQDTKLASIPFWRVTHYQLLDIDQSQQDIIPVIDSQPKAQWNKQPPQIIPLTTWRDLLPRIRPSISFQKAGRAIDSKAIVKHLSRVQPLNSIPRKKRRQWGQHAQIVVDKSRRLTPYWSDQLQLTQQLQQIFPKAGLQYGRYWDGMDAPMLTVQGKPATYSFPQPGSLGSVN